MNRRHQERGLGPAAPAPDTAPPGRHRLSRLTGAAPRRRPRRRPLRRVVRLLLIVGPGIIAANAGNDAGGIATYSQAGAATGYSLLWALVLITISVTVVQEMVARIGVTTGKELMSLIREEFPIGWTMAAAAAVLIANGGTVIAEFAGVGAAFQVLGLPPQLSAPVTGLLIGFLVLRSGYQRVERVFLALGAVFVAYLVTAVLVHPDWGQVAHGVVVPTFSLHPGFLYLFIAFIGTSISPYMQIYLQSAVVEKGTPASDYRMVRLEVITSSIFADLVAAAIVITVAATLHAHGITTVRTAAQAASALAPLAGTSARILFAVGLLGASLLAAGVLPLSTASAVAEAFGTERGVSASPRDARLFYTIFVGLLVVGGLVVLIPGLNLITVLIATQLVNGILLPVILVFLLRLVNNRRLMGDRVNGRWLNLIAGSVAAVLIVLTAALVVTTLAGA
ncbi:MAG TPA: Nramp family divalent metal transporter [Candidatus Dormibacteraeota bacterium]|nr:Nramp family divalent metal transporter [Candidatus Dormibacteraeota bacterium]